MSRTKSKLNGETQTNYETQLKKFNNDRTSETKKYKTLGKTATTQRIKSPMTDAICISEEFRCIHAGIWPVSFIQIRFKCAIGS